MFQSATRVSLLSMVFTLCLIMLYTTALYASFGAETYKMIFMAFVTILSNVASYFFGKSTAEQTAPPPPTEPVDEVEEALKK